MISTLSGCSTTPKQVQQDSSMTDVEATVGPALPEIELTSDLLSDLFIAEIALQRGAYDTAVEKYQRLALETQDPRLLERATRIAIFARDYQTALDVGKKWLLKDPTNVEGGQMLTALLLKAGDYDAALESLENVLKPAGDDEMARYLLMIRMLGREQDNTAALEVMRRFLDRHPDDISALYTYSQLSLRAGMVEEAEQTVDRLLEQKKDWPQAVILRTRILRSTKRESAALDYLGSVVARNPREIELRIAYGRMLADVDRAEESLEQFRKVLKLDPQNDNVLLVAGLVALRLDKIDEAEDYFLNLNDRAVRVDETGFYLGRIAEIREDFPRAIRWYSTVSNGENYLNAQIRSALLYAHQGDVEAGQALLHAAQARNPGQRIRLFLAEGEILRDIGQYHEAMAVYDRALNEVPGNTELLYARAMVAEKIDRLDILERDLLVILEREPDHVDALNSLGYTLADRTDRIDEAYDYVKRALELKPDSFYILDSMGWVLYRQGKLDEALDYLRRAMAASDDAEIAAHLGEVLWVQGDHEAARNIWNKALEHSPESSAVLNAIKRLEK